MEKCYGYTTQISYEEPEPNNPFAAKTSYCHGYDIYGDILTKAAWSEYIYLLFSGRKPTPNQTQLLEKLSIALANLGPREPSIRAAMNGGVGGCPHAASLISALAVGAGQYGGSHEVYKLVELWQRCNTDMEAWQQQLVPNPNTQRVDIWPASEHAPGFDPNGESCPTPVQQTLEVLCQHDELGHLLWLREHQAELETLAGCPLAMTGVAATTFTSLSLTSHAATMLYLILRLPGAAAHAIEQRHLGWRKFPFFADAIDLENDPGAQPTPDISEFEL